MEDRERWDFKYAGPLGRTETPPDSFVLEAIRALGPGAERRAVDLASGLGRHAVALAEQGWVTAAWDVSPVGLEVLSKRATARGLAITNRVVDLLTGSVAVDTAFDLVCVVDFFDAELWSRLSDLVVPGGHVIVRTFTLDWPGAKPPPRFRLVPGTLATGLSGMDSVNYEEEGGRAGLVARRPL